jgi:opine dehydrogenase
MSAVALVGAGAIARAYAALLSRDGHAAALWSPSGAGTRDLAPAATEIAGWPGVRAVRLACTGAVTGSSTVAVLDDPKRLADADVVIVAVPAPAYPSVLPVVARHVEARQTIIVSGALSLAPLWLAELAAARGERLRVAAFGTTVATARAQADGVAIMTVRTRLAVAALPTAAGAEALATCRALFGDRFDLADGVLAVTLTNINPVAHAAMALANFTRIERGEAWPQYHYLTPAVARLVEAMDAERLAVAAAYGQRVTTIEAHFRRSFDVPGASLAEIAAELHRRRGGPPGPTSLDTRFVLEDVPYGLVFNAALARIAGVPVPVTDSVVTLLSTLYARDFSTENPLIGALGLESETRERLLVRCAGDIG